MKLYALLNNRNQIIGRGNLLALLSQAKQCKTQCHIAQFRAGEKTGRVIASFDSGIKVKLTGDTAVNATVLNGANDG